MSKKITIKNPKIPSNPENWVKNRGIGKKVGIFLPLSIHTKLKIVSAQRNETMAEIIFKAIEKEIKDE